MTTRLRGKSIGRAVGLVVTLLSLGFVGATLSKYLPQVRGSFALRDFQLAIACGVIGYGISVQAVALAWRSLLNSVDVSRVSHFKAIEIFSRTQIYKYLPTNMFHMVGRFVIAHRLGVSKAALVYSQIWEIILMCVVACIVTAVSSAALIDKVLLDYNVIISVNYVLLFTCVLIVITIILFIVFKYEINESHWNGFKAILCASSYYVLFFVCNGVILICLVCVMAGTSMDLFSIIGLAAAAWLLGFVVPGAPGGLGVREAVLITGFSVMGIPTATATSIALGHRLITILADTLLALSVLLLTGRRVSK